MIQNFLYVICGGILGAALRYGMDLLMVRLFVGGYVFLYGVLSVNMLGCLLCGLFIGLFGGEGGGFGGGLRLFFVVGFLGSLTTFSSLVSDSFRLFWGGDFWGMVIYLFASLFLGLLFFFVGFKIVT